MSALLDVTSNKNFISPLGFKFLIKKLPNVNFFCQTANLPGISFTNTADYPNPLTVIPFAGDHIQYNSLILNFRVDENLKNYLEVHEWIKALGFPDSFQRYASLASKPPSSGDGIKSDASLIITTNGKIPQIEINFQDIFPISLSDLDFDVTMTSVDYITARAEFKYTLFHINTL